MEVLLLTKSNAIVPFILTDEPKAQIPTTVSKPKLACQLKIGATELRIYNGANQYILTSILKEITRVH